MAGTRKAAANKAAGRSARAKKTEQKKRTPAIPKAAPAKKKPAGYMHDGETAEDRKERMEILNAFQQMSLPELRKVVRHAQLHGEVALAWQWLSKCLHRLSEPWEGLGRTKW